MKEDPSKAMHAEHRRLVAIMFTDIVGFSRQMGSNEAHMLRLLETHNQIIQQSVTEHHGTVIKTIGDAFLVDFPSVVHAVQCAQNIQTQFRVYNADKEKTEKIHVRIGIHLGDVVQRDGDVFGDGVNIASRLQGLAESDTICLSDMVYRDVAKKLDLGTVVSRGRPKLKNIAERFLVYALLPEPPKGLRQTLRVQRLKLSDRAGTALRTLAAVALLLIGGGLIALRFPALSLFQGQLLPDKPSIAVLPFANMSDDPQQEYFSDGITEDLITAISKLSGLLIISRNSVFTYKGKAVKVADVSKDLGVRYVLEGSVRKADQHVRVTAQLIDATTDHHIWAEHYDRPLQDIFALQDEIVQKIVTTLKLQLTLQEQGILVRKTTDNLEAYDYLLRGTEYLWQGTKDANAQARLMLEKAVTLDPQYALAYVGLGRTYLIEWLAQWNRDPQVLKRAEELAQIAIMLDNSLPGPHTMLGRIYLDKMQHDQAITEAERAIALDPNWADGYAELALILAWSGRAEEAVELANKAVRLNPHSPALYQETLGFAYCQVGQYEDAIAGQKKAIARNPNLLLAHSCLAGCYSMAGRGAEARTQVKELLRISPSFSLELFGAVPWKNPTDGKAMFDALRKAGLK